MFGFSITKLLFTAAVIAAVWYGFKWLGRMQEQKAELDKQRAREEKVQARKDASRPEATAGPDVEEMVECPECGSFVAAQGAVNCGKKACPY